MSTKKVIFSVIGVAILAGIIYLVVKFQQSDKGVADYIVPQLQLAQMQLTNLTAEQADMNMNMVIDNPAPVGLNIDSLHYKVYIEGNEVVKTTYPDSIQVDANDTTTVSLPITIYYDKLVSVLDKLEKQGKDSVIYKIDATIFSDMDIIPKDTFNLEAEKLLPLVRSPEINITDLNVEDLSFSGATMKVEALVKNKNVFSFGFENMSYRLQIEDNEWMEGDKPGTVNIPAKDSATITIPVELNFKELGQGLYDLIRKGDELTYDFRLSTSMVSDEHILEESDITLNATGKLKTLVDVAKEQVKEN